jgi:ATP-dependent RNA helicase DHX57
MLEDDPVGSKIVVVQPRRIAATGVANRVAEERGEKQAGSGSVGYVVRGDSALCNKSRLVFCTTGVLLRQFQVEGALDCLTTIVIDEVHERNLDGDILLGLLKKVLPTKPHLRVVLMSATLATDSFKTYWGSHIPHVHIPGRTFPVTDFFLEDVLRLTGFVPSKKKKGHKSNSSSTWHGVEPVNEDKEHDVIQQQNPQASHHGIPIEELVGRVDETSPDPDIICRLLQRIIVNKDPSDDGSILVFLAGAPEIKNVEIAIRNKLVGVSTTVLPLHGGLQAKDQGRVFQPAQAGYTKIVLSTNVAETSVTIPDCTVVIDTYVLYVSISVPVYRA